MIVLISIGHLYLLLSVVWLGVRCDTRTDTKKTGIMCLEEIRLRLQRLLTILSSIVDLIEGTCLINSIKLRERIFMLIMNKVFTGEELQFYEEIDYGHDLDLPIISIELIAFFVCPTRSGCRAKSVRSRLAHLRRSSTLATEATHSFKLISKLSANI